MSSLNCEMFYKALKNDSFGKLKVDFNSLQEELFGRLLSEFISPIEREDIFILQKRLEEEFFSICSFSLLKSQEKNYFSEEIINLLKENVSIFSELKNFKMPKKLLKLLRENKVHTKNLLVMLMNSELEFKAFCVLKELTEKIFLTDVEIERIVLNNN